VFKRRTRINLVAEKIGTRSEEQKCRNDEVRRMEEKHRESLEQVKKQADKERTEALEQIKMGHAQELKTHEDQRKRDSEETDRRHAAETESIKSRHSTELTRLEAACRSRIDQLTSDHEQQLTALRQRMEEGRAEVEDLTVLFDLGRANVQDLGEEAQKRKAEMENSKTAKLGYYEIVLLNIRANAQDDGTKVKSRDAGVVVSRAEVEDLSRRHEEELAMRNKQLEALRKNAAERRRSERLDDVRTLISDSTAELHQLERLTNQCKLRLRCFSVYT